MISYLDQTSHFSLLLELAYNSVHVLNFQMIKKKSQIDNLSPYFRFTLDHFIILLHYLLEELVRYIMLFNRAISVNFYALCYLIIVIFKFLLFMIVDFNDQLSTFYLCKSLYQLIHCCVEKPIDFNH